MQVRCPKCDRVIDAEDINVSTDVAMCRVCNEAFSLPEALDRERAKAVDLDSPPRGAWFERAFDGFTVGATTRSWIAFFYVPVALLGTIWMTVMVYILNPFVSEFGSRFSLTYAPSFFIIILSWILALMAVCGKVRVTVQGEEGEVFTGIGSLGVTKRFNWPEITLVREESFYASFPGSKPLVIALRGKRRVGFTSLVRKTRRKFIIQALRKMLAERES